MKLRFAWFVAFGLLSASMACATEDLEILGVWRTTDDKSKVEIFRADGTFHGKIISLKEPVWPTNDEQGRSGKPKSDWNNPDPKLREQPIVGLQIMHGFTFSGKKRWEGGRVYDPENGKTYKCKLTLTSTNRLEVRGFIGISLLGRTEIWRRGD